MDGAANLPLSAHAAGVQVRHPEQRHHRSGRRGLMSLSLSLSLIVHSVCMYVLMYVIKVYDGICNESLGRLIFLKMFRFQ